MIEQQSRKLEKDEAYSRKNCSKLFTRVAELMKYAKQCSTPLMTTTTTMTRRMTICWKDKTGRTNPVKKTWTSRCKGLSTEHDDDDDRRRPRPGWTVVVVVLEWCLRVVLNSRWKASSWNIEPRRCPNVNCCAKRSTFRSVSFKCGFKVL